MIEMLSLIVQNVNLLVVHRRASLPRSPRWRNNTRAARIRITTRRIFITRDNGEIRRTHASPLASSIIREVIIKKKTFAGKDFIAARMYREIIRGKAAEIPRLPRRRAMHVSNSILYCADAIAPRSRKIALGKYRSATLRARVKQ